MVKKYICLVCLVVFVAMTGSQICDMKTKSGEMQKVCCADYETNGYDCVACSKGYTSDIGQYCRQCSANTYGDRCRYECSCLKFETCDNVEGCVEYLTAADTSEDATSSTINHRSKGKSCDSQNESGKTIKQCCAEYEEKRNMCIPCSKGYTSNKGHNCTPCPINTYGERCKFDCSCSGFQICDHVKGCVGFQLTTDTSVYATSHDRTSQLITGTGTYYDSDISSVYDEEIKGCSVQGLLSREIIVYSTLSVVVIGFGICLCFVVLKYTPLNKKNIITINQTQNTSITQQIQTIEIADGLYDIINEVDVLDDRRIQQIQKQMSSEYLDVIHDPNTRESCVSKKFEKQNNTCLLPSIDQTQNQENNLKVDGHSLMSGDNSSSSDEYQWDSTQDYLNPYQPMIEISPPVEHKYLTITTSHNRGDGNYKDSTVVRNAYELQHPREMENDDMTNLHDKYKSSSISIGSNVSKGVSNREGEKESKSYENLKIDWFKIEIE